ncbi:Phosphatidylcholine-sterol acyltransferase [Halotydeus destructor]|nr:Phosphatidylcholine-sterol acyltransferase [Halotydeus destructor]
MGSNFGVEGVVKGDYRGLMRSWSQTYSTLPSVTVFRDQTLVSYNGRHYTASDYRALFKLYDIPYARHMYEDCKDLGIQLPHPMVDVHCIHGNGHDTTEGFVYDADHEFPGDPKLLQGPGDKVVNLISLKACQRWSSEPRYKFSYAEVDNATHDSILSDSRAINLVKQIILT